MKFKTKYNVGDIVEFRTFDMKKNMIGKIDSLVVKFISFETKTDVVYHIRMFEIGKPLFMLTMKDVHEYDIEKRLCSKDFWRKYSELAAEKIVKGDNA